MSKVSPRSLAADSFYFLLKHVFALFRHKFLSRFKLIKSISNKVWSIVTLKNNKAKDLLVIFVIKIKFFKSGKGKNEFHLFLLSVPHYVKRDNSQKEKKIIL